MFASSMKALFKILIYRKIDWKEQRIKAQSKMSFMPWT